MLGLATNEYGWTQIAERDGRDWSGRELGAMEDAATAGLTHWEPFIRGPGDLTKRLALAARVGLGVRSAYFGTTLHNAASAHEARVALRAIVDEAKGSDLQYLVTNPDPISWTQAHDKSDAELIYQAAQLEELGHMLREARVRLCYHSHDAEMRRSAREFHHMMLGTTQQAVGLCLDAHWVWRGSGNSQLALMDIVGLYHSRIEILHLRQSQKGVWDETVRAGDVDYQRLADKLNGYGVHPAITIEHAIENGTPSTLSELEAHRKSAEFARKVFSVEASTR